MNVDALRQHKNNFDALRLLLSLTVVLVHIPLLSGISQFTAVSRFLSARIAVHGFFVISGFLITLSYESKPKPREYFIKRVRRIYPAYVAVILLSMLGGLLVTSLPIWEYISSRSGLGYLLANLSFLNFLQPTLPGVFETNPIAGVVNGALWSIKIEVMCYCLVPFMVMLGRRVGSVGVCVAVYLLSVIMGLVLLDLRHSTEIKMYDIFRLELSGPIASFASGAIGCYCFELFQRRSKLVLGLAVFVLMWIRWLPDGFGRILIEPVALAAVVLFAAYCLPYFGNFGRFGDLSYGIYIYHFPIIQLMAFRGDFVDQPVWFLVWALVLTIVAAFLSWHLIEKRWLRRDSHYVRANQAIQDDVVGQLRMVTDKGS